MLQLREHQTDDDVQDRQGRRDDAVRPEDRAADEPLEGIARRSLRYLRECERRRGRHQEYIRYDEHGVVKYGVEIEPCAERHQREEQHRCEDHA